MNKIISENLNLNETNFNGARLCITEFENFFLSTAYAFDTKKYESMFVDQSSNPYKLLQVYETQIEAKEGHIFWAKKIKNGFIPENDIIDQKEVWNFDSIINFINSLSKFVNK